MDYNWVLLPIWFRRYWFVGFVDFPCLLIWVAFDIASSFDFSENHYNWEKSLVCGRLYQLFRPFFWIDWRWYVSFVVFLCLLVWVGFWHWLLCDFSECHYNWEDIGLREVVSTFSSLFSRLIDLGMWFLLFFCASKFEGLLTLIVPVISLSAITIERTLVWREGIYTFPPSFLPLRKKKETLSATLFLLFWTALDLVCFLHFESLILRLIFFFFLLDTSLSSALTAVVSINLFICYDALLIYFLFLVQRSTPICLLSVEACDAGFLLPSSG